MRHWEHFDEPDLEAEVVLLLCFLRQSSRRNRLSGLERALQTAWNNALNPKETEASADLYRVNY